jgi:ribonuclease BN (tRNA processing enzyme)
MRLTVLGSGTFQPTPNRGCSGYLIQSSNNNILFDAGPGVLRQLAQIGLAADDIDVIFLSHYHLDHTGELPLILFAKRHSQKLPKKSLTVYGPPSIETFYNGLLQLYTYTVEPDGYQLLLRSYTKESIIHKDFCVYCLPVQHTDNSYGIRIEEKSGIVLAYSGDSGVCENLITLCQNSDIAILECSLPDEFKVPGHLTPGEAGKIADKAHCKRVLLTHFYPETEQVSNVKAACFQFFKGEILVAEELALISIE